MKVFMLGWEFAPIKSGGLGVACKGIASGLVREGVDVTFVLPSYLHNSYDHVDGSLKVISNKMKTLRISVDSNYIFSPYQGLIEDHSIRQEISKIPLNKRGAAIYGREFWREVSRFGDEARELAKEHSHDVIHAHDWMTYPAGKKVQKFSGRPLVVHVHATEMDRTAGHPNQAIFDIEKEGLHFADRVIVVSNLTKKILEKYYDVPANKISVVHNANVIHDGERKKINDEKIQKTDKVVLFLGRVTVQKGPEYFVDMAKLILSKRKDVKFVIAGDGDMMSSIVHRIIANGLQENIICAGFLGGDDLNKAYYHADLYVMPSVSEPFGLTALEAVEFKTPVLLSKTTGVGEVLKNCLTVDYWDVEKMAGKVMAVLDYPLLSKTMVKMASHETAFLTWHKQAANIKKIYGDLLK